MKNIFLMWYEKTIAPKAYRLFIEPRYCLMTKDEVKEHVAEYNKTHSDNYRYYYIPQLWQRTRPDGDEESISDIKRFMTLHYLQDNKFVLEYTHNDDVTENDKIKKYIKSSTKNLFKKQYYDLINFIREDLDARISKISVQQDDISTKMIMIDIEVNDELHTIIMKRVDVV